MKSVNPLSDKIATYIVSQGARGAAPVSMTAIFERARGRFSDKDVSDALSYIHRHRKDIKVTVKDDDNWYQLQTIKVAKVHNDTSWREHRNKVREEWRTEQERLRALDPTEYDRVEDIMARVGEFVWIEAGRGKKWLVPRGTEEHYNKLIHGNTGRTGKKRRVEVPQR